MQLILCFLSIFLATAAYADSELKIYDIFNFTGMEFMPRPNETTPQCKQIASISATTRSCKFIDLDEKDRFYCIALSKKDETCGLLLNVSRQLIQAVPFGQCHLKFLPQKISMRIDRFYLGSGT